MKKGLGLCVLLFFVCVSCSVIKVNADENNNTYGNDNYTITVSSVVSMTDSQKSGSIDIKYNLNSYVNVDVEITSEHDHKLVCGNQSIPYSLTDSNIILSSAKSEEKNSAYSIGVQVLEDATVSGTYTDILTFTMTDKSYFEEAAKHKLSFDLNADDDPSVVISTTEKNVTEGAAYGLLPAPTRDGYQFDGWYTEAIDGNKIEDSTIMGERDTTVYAHWTPNELIIIYHNDGAEYIEWDGIDEDVTGQDYTKSSVEKYGEKFTNGISGLYDSWRWKKEGRKAIGGGWKIGKEGTKVYSHSRGFEKAENCADFLGVLEEFKKGKVTVDLYPIWPDTTYTVKYDGNGSTSGSTASSVHTYEVSKALTLNRYVRDGYEFNGWNTAKDGTGMHYADGASVINLTPANGATVTLYAQWKEISVENDSQNEDFSYSIINDELDDNVSDDVDIVDSDDVFEETDLNTIVETSDVEVPVTSDEETVD